MNLTPTTSSQFNRLPDVATAHLRATAFGKISRANEILRPVFLRHGAARYWGISLLHIHWRLEQAEVAVQRSRRARIGVEYVMQPEIRGPRCWPCNIIVSNDAPYFLPFEFTKEPLAEIGNQFLEDNPMFCSELKTVFQLHSFGDTFGLVLARTAMTPGRELVEYTLDNRTSVIKEVPPGKHGRHALTETSWVFDPDRAMMACKTKCFETTQHQVYHDPNS